MHGIISLLSPPAYAQVEAIWQMLEASCGLSGIKITPLAHLSWQIADQYDFELARQTLERVARDAHPFSAVAGGLGIFTGPVPVVYIPVVKDENLLKFHARLWKEMDTLSKGASPYYSPQLWIPHITMAYGDVDAGKLNCAMQKLAFQPLELAIRVDNLALVYQEEGKEGWLKYRFAFGD
jgi:2'-5' RNA ligase